MKKAVQIVSDFYPIFRFQSRTDFGHESDEFSLKEIHQKIVRFLSDLLVELVSVKITSARIRKLAL
jgi:hypothetical protein